MNPIIKKSNKKAAFTIIELLTVMSIIVVLISLLIPSLNMVRRYAKSVRQKAQLGSIGTALELFSAEHDGYPPSAWDDPTGVAYCGAMKLAEAMMGQDLLGFHPDSRFRSDGTDPALLPPDLDLYPRPAPATPYPDWYIENLQRRKGPYLQPEYANVHKLKYLYGVDNTGAFPTGEEVVLCDVYLRVVLKPDPTDPPGLDIGRKSGMPILYYRANTSNNLHDVDAVDLPIVNDDKDNIYNFWDNHMLTALGLPWNLPPAGPDHPLFLVGAEPQGKRFYEITWNRKITTAFRPCRSDSYILLSAGFDGEYGTDDDVFNFKK